MFNGARLVSMSERAGTPWRSYTIHGRCYEEELLSLLAPVPVLAEEVAAGPTKFVPPRMSIHYQGTYGSIEDIIPPAPEGERFVERSIPRHQTWFSRKVVTPMARCINAFRSQLVRMRNVATCCYRVILINYTLLQNSM